MKNVAQEVQAKIIELGQAGKKPGLIAVMTKVKKDDIIAILKEAGIEVEGTPVQDTKAPDAAVVGADAAAPVVEGDAANAAPVEGDETQINAGFNDAADPHAVPPPGWRASVVCPSARLHLIHNEFYIHIKPRRPMPKGSGAARLVTIE